MTTSEPAARAGSFLFLSFSCPLRTIANGRPPFYAPLRTLVPGSPRTRQPRRPATAPAQRYELRFSRISKVVQCDGALFTDMPRRSTEGSAEHDLSALPAQRQSVSRRRRFIRSGAGHKCGRQMLYSHV